MNAEQIASNVKLVDAAAFEALFRFMAGHRGGFQAQDPLLQRLQHALTDKEASALDVAVLMRHALRAEYMRRGVGPAPRLPLPTSISLTAQILESVGLQKTNASEIESLPWRPAWLGKSGDDGVDDAAAAATRRRHFARTDERPDADPFFQCLGWPQYRSVGQRAAIRAALLLNPGDTLAIDLPTGEGKSMVFQAIDRIGFASDPVDAGARPDGITLVIVPTVALAYDHELSCRRDQSELLAYVGSGRPEDQEAIRERLRTTQRGLCFAAPEAVAGSLRSYLREASKGGRVKAIVIDEAHLVDAWGTGFRSDFQVLSGLRSELIALSPKDRAPRTILLSATLTPEALATLKALYSDPGEFRHLSASQVRPEPDYWVAKPCARDQRDLRIDEALLHVPRPAILYVTEVKHARAWEARLRAMGFSRFDVFHGDTLDPSRQRILKKWRDGALDLVVATSAFGLGIDYAHVRAVLHACVPETFDRFYQEVGRAGRDGCTAISIAVPAHPDFQTARRINTRQVITIKRGRERWLSMFQHPGSQHLGGLRRRLRLDVAPGFGEKDIDLLSKRGDDWNARVLTLLARAQLIRLLGSENDSVSEGDEADTLQSGKFETVEIVDTAHPDEATWRTRVEPVRRSIAAASRRNLELMLRHLDGTACPADLVVELYGASAVDRACSRCSVCRSDHSLRRTTDLRREPPSPWPAPPLSGPLWDLVRQEHRLLVPYKPQETSSFQIRRTAETFRTLYLDGLRCVLALGTVPALFRRAFDEMSEVPVFLERPKFLADSRLPCGPQLVLIGPGENLDRANLTPDANRPRLFFIPRDLADPDRPNSPLLDRYPGSVVQLEDLLPRLRR